MRKPYLKKNAHHLPIQSNHPYWTVSFKNLSIVSNFVFLNWFIISKVKIESYAQFPVLTYSLVSFLSCFFKIEWSLCSCWDESRVVRYVYSSNDLIEIQFSFLTWSWSQYRWFVSIERDTIWVIGRPKKNSCLPVPEPNLPKPWMPVEARDRARALELTDKIRSIWNTYQKVNDL
jgi:hypothetical protein